MNLWPTTNIRPEARIESTLPVSATAIHAQDQRSLRAQSNCCRWNYTPLWSARSLGLAALLALALIFTGVIQSAHAQSSATLAWDASASSGISGYRLYVGGASRTYTTTIAAGNATTATASGLTSGAKYFFAVTAVDTNGLESDYSTEITYTVPLPTNAPPSVALISPASGTTYVAPATRSLVASVTANGHTISQVQFYVGATLLGTDTTAPYIFAWNNISAGNYSLSAKVIYDSGSSAASAVANITVAATPPASKTPRLRIGRGSSGTGTQTAKALSTQVPFTLSADGIPGQVYSVLASRNLVTWTVIGTMTMDNTGTGEFTDSASSLLPTRYYRLQGQ